MNLRLLNGKITFMNNKNTTSIIAGSIFILIFKYLVIQWTSDRVRYQFLLKIKKY